MARRGHRGCSWVWVWGALHRLGGQEDDAVWGGIVVRLGKWRRAGRGGSGRRWLPLSFVIVFPLILPDDDLAGQAFALRVGFFYFVWGSRLFPFLFFWG